MRMLPAATLSNTEGEPCNKALFLSYSGGPRTFVLIEHTFSIKPMLDMCVPCNPSRCLRSVRSPQVVGSCQASDRFPWCVKNLQNACYFLSPPLSMVQAKCSANSLLLESPNKKSEAKGLQSQLHLKHAILHASTVHSSTIDMCSHNHILISFLNLSKR